MWPIVLIMIALVLVAATLPGAVRHDRYQARILTEDEVRMLEADDD